MTLQEALGIVRQDLRELDLIYVPRGGLEDTLLNLKREEWAIRRAIERDNTTEEPGWGT